MAININHSNDSFSSNSKKFIFGTGIAANQINTIYANNFCSFEGKYYGDGSALTGISVGDLSSYVTTSQTGDFVTTGQTGDFVTTGQTGDFIATGQTGDFVSCLLIKKFVTESTSNTVINSPDVSFSSSSSNNIVINGSGNNISMGASNNLIFGCINTYYNDSIIGCCFIACSNVRIGGKICSFGDIEIVEGYGSFIGDGSRLTGLATGDFVTTSMTGDLGGGGDLTDYITTGQTGSFITTDQTGSFITTEQTGSFITTDQTGTFYSTSRGFLDSSCNFEVKLNNSIDSQTGDGTYNIILQGECNILNSNAQFNFISATEVSTIETEAKYNSLLGTRCSKVEEYSTRNTILGGRCNEIKSYSTSSSILGGCKNKIGQGNRHNAILGGCGNEIANSTMEYEVKNTVILGGSFITGASCNTAYANNFCAYEGKFYGDGSSLTGISSQSIALSHCSIIVSGSGPYNPMQEYDGAKSSSIIIAADSSYMYNTRYFTLDCEAVVDFNLTSRNNQNLYPISNNASNMYTFNATVIGQANYSPVGLRPTAIKIEGVIFSGQILSQVKTFYVQDSSDNVCALVEDGHLKLMLSGINNGYQGNKTWSARLDILESPTYIS